MTLRRIIRELDAAQKRANRQAARARRLAEREAKLQAKLDAIECAELEVEEYTERIEQLTTIHHFVGEEMDWDEIYSRPPPVPPKKLIPRETDALKKLERFRPTFFQRLLGSDKKLRAKLESNLDDARRQDENSYQGALKLHENQVARWDALHGLAAAIRSGDRQAYLDAIEELEPLAEIREFGSQVEIALPDPRTAEVDLVVEGEAVVPKETKSLLQSGKLSTKAMPSTKFYELYQDYVCGCALRVARELFSFLPLDRVIVNVKTPMLDSSTGRLVVSTVLTCGMPRSTIGGMNFEAVDPSDSMQLFKHRMGFRRGKGFSPIEPLSPEEYPSSSAG